MRKPTRLHLWLVMAAVGVVLLVAPVVPLTDSLAVPKVNSADTVVSVSGQTSPVYLLTGFGQGPFANPSFVDLGSESILVFFKGTHVAYVEGPFNGQATYNPENVIEINSFPPVPGSNGSVQFTATIRNIGSLNVLSAIAFLDFPEYGTNITHAGVVWQGLPSYSCGTILAPKDICQVKLSLEPRLGLAIESTYPLSWVVGGATSTESVLSLNQTNFLFRESFSAQYPGSGPNPIWMNSFVGTVNSHRGGIQLVENQTVDAFAHTRFLTDVSNYAISDYGFDGQAAAFFNGTGKAYTEEILYPSGFAPGAFASYIEQSAPGHWNGLIDTAYTQYGYFLGTGPAIIFTGCSVTEINGRNVNITQVAIENGCTYKVQNEIYLVIVLSN
ncbi:MAG: hypothetical protein OK452_10075 [Thaumarchaeota archaeon]|nr:hypothetical protein [Nitrososphaerota archaeon]